MSFCQCFVCLISRAHHTKPAFHKRLIQIHSLVGPVIVIKLTVRNCSVIADPVYSLPVDPFGCRTVDDRF